MRSEALPLVYEFYKTPGNFSGHDVADCCDLFVALWVLGNQHLFLREINRLRDLSENAEENDLADPTIQWFIKLLQHLPQLLQHYNEKIIGLSKLDKKSKEEIAETKDVQEFNKKVLSKENLEFINSLSSVVDISKNPPTLSLPHGDSLLHIAIRGGDVKLFQAAQKKGVTIDQANQHGITPRMLAQYSSEPTIKKTYKKNHSNKRTKINEINLANDSQNEEILNIVGILIQEYLSIAGKNQITSNNILHLNDQNYQLAAGQTIKKHWSDAYGIYFYTVHNNKKSSFMTFIPEVTAGEEKIVPILEEQTLDLELDSKEADFIEDIELEAYFADKKKNSLTSEGIFKSNGQYCRLKPGQFIQKHTLTDDEYYLNFHSTRTEFHTAFPGKGKEDSDQIEIIDLEDLISTEEGKQLLAKIINTYFSKKTSYLSAEHICKVGNKYYQLAKGQSILKYFEQDNERRFQMLLGKKADVIMDSDITGTCVEETYLKLIIEENKSRNEFEQNDDEGNRYEVTIEDAREGNPKDFHVVKFLRPGEARPAPTLKTVENEVTLLRKASMDEDGHQYNKKAKPIQIAENQYAIIMRKAHGKTLSQLLKLKERNLADRYQIALNIARNLKRIHEKEILHLDFRPSQVIVDMNADAEIIDLGAAELMQEGVAIIRGSLIVGLVPYMPPEISFPSQERQITTAADAFSFGVVLLELLVIPEKLKVLKEIESQILREYNEGWGTNSKNLKEYQKFYADLLSPLLKLEEDYFPSEEAKDTYNKVVKPLLSVDPTKRLTLDQCIDHLSQKVAQAQFAELIVLKRLIVDIIKVQNSAEDNRGYKLILLLTELGEFLKKENSEELIESLTLPEFIADKKLLDAIQKATNSSDSDETIDQELKTSVLEKLQLGLTTFKNLDKKDSENSQENVIESFSDDEKISSTSSDYETEKEKISNFKNFIHFDLIPNTPKRLQLNTELSRVEQLGHLKRGQQNKSGIQRQEACRKLASGMRQLSREYFSHQNKNQEVKDDFKSSSDVKIKQAEDQFQHQDPEIVLILSDLKDLLLKIFKIKQVDAFKSKKITNLMGNEWRKRTRGATRCFPPVEKALDAINPVIAVSV